jgi:hypothetical protein
MKGTHAISKVITRIDIHEINFLNETRIIHYLEVIKMYVAQYIIEDIKMPRVVIRERHKDGFDLFLPIIAQRDFPGYYQPISC